MNRCRIIRGIIVVAFIACLCASLFVSSNNIKKELRSLDIQKGLIYILLVFVSTIGYALLKRKLHNSNCDKKLEYIYRYIYLIVFILLTRFLSTWIYKYESDLSLISPSVDNGLGSYAVYILGKLTLRPLYSVIILNTIITTICMVIIKRIVFNVTTNEMLSAIAAIWYIFSPKAIYSTTFYSRYNFNLMFIVAGIYMLLKVIDEIKQHKLKNVRYIIYSLIMSFFIMIEILFGGSVIFWATVIAITVLVSKDVDYLHIIFKKEMLEKFPLGFRRNLYKIERMRISKFIAILGIVICFLGVTILALYFTNQNIIVEKSFGLDAGEIINLMEKCFTTNKLYYILTFLFTILLEMICFGLGRKQDTKSAIIKYTFIAALITSVLSEGVYSEIVLSALIVVNLVIDMGNIYYNREEKVKLLKEKN